MAVSHDVILLLYGLATAIAIVLGIVVWRHRETPGAVPLVGTLIGAAVFSGSRFVATAVDSTTLSILMEQTLYVGVGLSVMATLLFALEYTGREHLVTRKTVAVLSIEPIIVVVLAFTNPGNVFFESLGADPTMPTGVGVDWGTAFELHTVYSYLLMAASTAMILEFLYNARALYRGQAAALFGATTLPWLANIVHVVGPIEADTTPIGYVVMGLLYAIAIVRYRFIDVVPIARDRVLDTVSEGVFVLDREERLVDINPAGRAMLDLESETAAIGLPLHSLFADDPEVIDLITDLTATTDESTAELTYDDGYYEVQATPITDGRDRHVGWLALVYDITERKQREAALERHNERLDRFASLVSHDLRNPLTVASGYLELARESEGESESGGENEGDHDTRQHLAEIERAHDRMETIIEDVLLLAREGETVTAPELVELEALARRAWETVETGSASLSVETDVTIRADPERGRRLLENLFRNAVEHGSTSPGSSPLESGTDRDRGPDSLEVTVGAIEREDGDGIDGFYVADNGTGIPDGEHERILEDGYSTGDGGTGLGLSIVREIASAHGWSVTATDSETGGARFEFTGVDAATAGRTNRPERA